MWHQPMCLPMMVGRICRVPTVAGGLPGRAGRGSGFPALMAGEPGPHPGGMATCRVLSALR
jgi:hypothetical protein